MFRNMNLINGTQKWKEFNSIKARDMCRKLGHLLKENTDGEIMYEFTSCLGNKIKVISGGDH